MNVNELREEVNKTAKNHTNGSTKVLNTLYQTMGRKKYIFVLNDFKAIVNKSALKAKEKKGLISKAEKVKVWAKNTKTKIKSKEKKMRKKKK